MFVSTAADRTLRSSGSSTHSSLYATFSGTTTAGYSSRSSSSCYWSYWLLSSSTVCLDTWSRRCSVHSTALRWHGSQSVYRQSVLCSSRLEMCSVPIHSRSRQLIPIPIPIPVALMWTTPSANNQNLNCLHQMLHTVIVTICDVNVT